MSEKIIADNFEISNLIGKGAFGEIYISKNKRDKNDVIIKKEIKKSEKICQLKIESKIYKSLLNISSNDISGKNNISQDEVQGIPYFYGMGELSDSYYLILELLGLDLNQLFNFCKNKFSITTTCLIALQMLNRIENIHKHFFIHRDIKPENFLIGSKEKSNIIFLIDFGLSKKYKDSKTNQHIPYKEGKNLTGTVRYASIFTHLGFEQSRRDDLEGISYVLIYFLKGSLPWMGMKGKNKKEKYDKIKNKKINTSLDKLCEDLPNEFIDIVNYPRKLKFEEEPNYDFIYGLIEKIMMREKYEMDFKYDWVVFGYHEEKDNNKSNINLLNEDNKIDVENENNNHVKNNNNDNVKNIIDNKNNNNVNNDNNENNNNNGNNHHELNKKLSGSIMNLLEPDIFLSKEQSENYHNYLNNKI